MEGAVRAADVDRVVAPKATAEHLARLRKVQDISTAVGKVLPEFILPPAGAPKPGATKAYRKSRPPNTTTDAYVQVAVNAVGWAATLRQLQQDEDFPFKDVKPQVTTLLNALTKLMAPGEKIQVTDSEIFDGYKENL